MPESDQKRRGRPAGDTKRGEPADCVLNLRVTKTARDWVKSQPRGTLVDLVERLARGEAL